MTRAPSFTPLNGSDCAPARSVPRMRRAVAGMAALELRPVEQAERRVVANGARVGRGGDAGVGRGAQQAAIGQLARDFRGELVEAHHDSNVTNCCNAVKLRSAASPLRRK